MTDTGWWEAVLDLAADPLSGAVDWPPQCAVDVAIMESLMSYHVGSLGVIRLVMSYTVSLVCVNSSLQCFALLVGRQLLA